VIFAAINYTTLTSKSARLGWWDPESKMDAGQPLEMGVDWISVGALSHSGAAVDLSFAIEPE
jgi:hypothetical protein